MRGEDSSAGPEHHGGELDPQAAAALLEHATKRAERQLDPRPPLVLVLGAVLFLVAFGTIWWSVRDQHPYDGPSGSSLAVLYSIVIAWSAVVVMVFRRATVGVGGRSRERQRIEGVAFGAAFVSVYVFQGALHHAGASRAITYGIYPATALFIILGAAAAANGAARADWTQVGTAVAVLAIASGAAFAGPATVWLVMGIGLCAVLIGLAAAQTWQRRASRIHV